MIRYLETEEKGRCLDLWREAFPEDSTEFCDYYFKEKMNISLKQYVTNKRVVLAKEYLLSDMPLAEISDSCGFSSAVYFSSVFRQSVGITPSQYREQCRRIDLVGETAEEEKP